MCMGLRFGTAGPSLQRPRKRPMAACHYLNRQEVQMEIAVIEVHGTSDLKQWVELPNALYRGDVNYIPQILREELAFFAREEPVV
jgi:hypothetical protein